MRSACIEYIFTLFSSRFLFRPRAFPRNFSYTDTPHFHNPNNGCVAVILIRQERERKREGGGDGGSFIFSLSAAEVLFVVTVGSRVFLVVALCVTESCGVSLYRMLHLCGSDVPRTTQTVIPLRYRQSPFKSPVLKLTRRALFEVFVSRVVGPFFIATSPGIDVSCRGGNVGPVSPSERRAYERRVTAAFWS